MDIPVAADMESKGEGSVINQQSSKQTRCLVISSSLILGASAGVPYFSPARDAAGNNIVLGYFYGASTLLVFGISSTWGWHHILKELIERHRNSEGQITTKTILSIIFAFFLAICSGAISFYVVSKYNDSLAYPILTTINNFGLDASGYYKIITYMTSRSQNSEQNSTWICNAIKFLKIAILIFPLGNLIINAYLSFKAGGELVNNTYADLPFGLLALSTFALDVFGSQEIIHESPCNNEVANAGSSRCDTVSAFILKLFSFALVLFATSSRAFIATDNFGENIFGYIYPSHFKMRTSANAVFENYL